MEEEERFLGCWEWKSGVAGEERMEEKREEDWGREELKKEIGILDKTGD